MTSDGILVVLHDPTLDRTATGPQESCTGAVATKTLAQIKTCQSFHPESLQAIHALDATLPLIQLYFDAPSSTIVSTLPVVAEYPVGIGPAKGSVDAALVAGAHARCLELHPYTVNAASEMAELISLGVDGMFTNFPDRLANLQGPTNPPLVCSPTAVTVASASALFRGRTVLVRWRTQDESPVLGFNV